MSINTKPIAFNASFDSQGRLSKLKVNQTPVLNVVYVAGNLSTYQWLPAFYKLSSTNQDLIRVLVQTYIEAQVLTQIGNVILNTTGLFQAGQHSIQVPNFIKNGCFINGLTSWDYVGGGSVIDPTQAPPNVPYPSCKLINAAFIGQFLPPVYGSTFRLVFYDMSLNGSANNLMVTAQFNDGTTEQHQLTASQNIWRTAAVSFTTAKPLQSVFFTGQALDTVWLSVIQGWQDAFDYNGDNCVLPKALNKTPIFQRNTATNATVTVYTVTSGKTFYLVGAVLSGIGTSGAAALRIAGTNLVVLNFDGTDHDEEMPFPLAAPMPFPGGTVFAVVSTTATVQGDASIMGWEE